MDAEVYSLRLKVMDVEVKENDVLGFKICLKKNNVLINLACVHVHIGMQQSNST
jgi:hypothetical protein